MIIGKAIPKPYNRDASRIVTGNLPYAQLPTGGGTWANGGALTISGGAVTISQGSLTIGSGQAGVDYTITVIGENNTGVLTWMENEAAWYFQDNVGVGKSDPDYLFEVAGDATTDEIRSHMGFDIYPVERPTNPTGALQAGTELEVGTYRYFVTYTTALGESQENPNYLTVTTTAGNERVLLTIPTSSDPRVTGRKLYRTTVGGEWYRTSYLDAVADNTTTEYLDVIPDASLPGTITGIQYGKANTTSNYISVNGTSAMLLDYNLTAIGNSVGKPTGSYTTVIGTEAAVNATSGLANFIGGYQAAYNIGSMFNSVIIGALACDGATGGRENTIIGKSAVGNSTDSDLRYTCAFGSGSLLAAANNGNCGFGYASGQDITSGAYNSFFGYNTGNNASQAVNALYSIAIGANSFTTKSYQCVLGATDITETLLRGHIIIGQGTAGVDYTITIDGETKDFVWTWMEDEGYLDFSHPIVISDQTLLGTPVAGALEYDNDRMYLTNVATQRAIDRTSDVATSTVTVANTTTETTIFTGTVPADSLKTGNILKLYIDGIVSTASAADIVTIRVKMGGTTMSSTTSGGAVLSDDCWHGAGVATLRSTGAAAPLAWHFDIDVAGTNSEDCGIDNVDTTSSGDITVTVQWNNAKAGNTISLYQGFLEYKN